MNRKEGVTKHIMLRIFLIIANGIWLMIFTSFIITGAYNDIFYIIIMIVTLILNIFFIWRVKSAKRFEVKEK